MCIKCDKKSVYSRRMCKKCYVQNSDTFEHIGNASTSYFVECCRNGIIKELLEAGFRYEDIGEKFEISHGTVQKYISLFDLYKYSHFRKAVPKTPRKKEDLEFSEAQMLALCTPWVKTKTPRYHLPI